MTKKSKIVSVITAALILGAAVIVYVSIPPYDWYVEEGLEEQWGRILRAAPPPQKFRKILVYREQEQTRRPGVIITAKREEGPEKAVVYSYLSFEPVHEGAYVLALDPWMVFRKHMNPSLTLERVRAPGSGLLLIPGGEQEARDAWVARQLEEEPGTFPPEPERWLEQEEKLFIEPLFISGARTMRWEDSLISLMGDDVAWLYAPLSAIRRYPDPRTSVLEAASFPQDASRGRNSLQARLLWAIPAGSDKQKARLRPALDWLQDPATQTVIADELQWIPAVPRAKPFNPVSMRSYMQWLTTAYIYELRGTPR
jgi:hypothetical protein